MKLMLPLIQKREASVKNIYTEFSKHFEIIDVNTPELVRETFRLRYQTMCVEHGFLNTSAYPDDMERDEHDDRSASVIIRRITVPPREATRRSSSCCSAMHARR
jgi:hypothetical protein